MVPHVSNALARMRPLVALAALLVGSPARAQDPATLINANLPLNNSSPAWADLNNDGKVDLIFASTGSSLTGGIIPPVTCSVEMGGTNAQGKKKTAGPKAPTPEASPPAVGIWVHALDGATNYTTELPGTWPRQIRAAGGCDAGAHPTVSINILPATNYLAGVVGGDFGWKQMFAFQPDGTDVPGFPANSDDPPFFNASPAEDANNDGAVDIVGADESCALQRWNGTGVRRQCQWLAQNVSSSPAVFDAGRLNSQLADGIRDEVGAGLTTPFEVRIYSSFGKSQACSVFDQPPPDMLFSKGSGDYSSSLVGANLDSDTTQDITIVSGTSNKVQVFSSADGLQEYSLLPANTPTIGAKGYSSPTIADIDGTGDFHTILVGADSGHLVALTYRPDQVPRLALRWQTLLDASYAVSSSPVVARLLPGPRPQIVVGTDKGNVYIVDADGNILSSYNLLNGNPVIDATASVWATAAIGTRRIDPTGDTCVPDGGQATNCPIIVAGNRRGLFRIDLTSRPPFDPAGAQWPTFRRNNKRTGALDPEQDGSQTPIPTRGSVAGVAGPSCRSTDVRLLYPDGSPVIDYYTEMASHETPLSDGRFLFELLFPGSYKVRFNNDPSFDLDADVSVGVLTLASRASCP